jgi:hypothetical protein
LEVAVAREEAMPFDSAEFFSGNPPRVPPGRRRRAMDALTSALRRMLRSVPPEPTDLALLRVLEEARGLIELPEDWTQGTYESWCGERCAIGALRAAASHLAHPAAGAAAHALLAGVVLRRGFSSVEAMNDHSRHDEVLAVFDEALAAARLRTQRV